MKEVLDRYEALLGYKPDIYTVHKLNRIAKVLNIRDNDALWGVVVALELYNDQYNSTAKALASEVRMAITLVKDTADDEVRKATARAIEAIAKETGRIGQEIAETTAGRDRAKWMAIMVVACVSAVLLTGTVFFYVGHKTGSAATDEATLWALTETGRKAREMSDGGDYIHMMYDCSGPGWSIEAFEGQLACHPASGSGWFMPWRK